MSEAEKLEYEIMQKALQLAELRRKDADVEVPDYQFSSKEGAVSLAELFGDKDQLLMIHNMGQACRYCTLWADGINGVVPHLEDAMSVVFISKDDPETQRNMALNRGWRFRMVSHGGGEYMNDQCAFGEMTNFPGAAVFEKKNGKIVRRAKTAFGPGDLYSPVWHFLSLAGKTESDWTPQFQYWQRPKTLEDGGENIRD